MDQDHGQVGFSKSAAASWVVAEIGGGSTGCSWVGELGGGLRLGGGWGEAKKFLKDHLPSGLQGDQPVK